MFERRHASINGRGIHSHLHVFFEHMVRHSAFLVIRVRGQEWSNICLYSDDVRRISSVFGKTHERNYSRRCHCSSCQAIRFLLLCRACCVPRAASADVLSTHDRPLDWAVAMFAVTMMRMI